MRQAASREPLVGIASARSAQHRHLLMTLPPARARKEAQDESTMTYPVVSPSLGLWGRPLPDEVPNGPTQA